MKVQTNQDWEVVKRVGVAYAVYSLFWLMLIGISVFDIWKVLKFRLVERYASGEFNLLSLLLGLVLYLMPVFISIAIIAYTVISTWKKAGLNPASQEFTNHILHCVAVIFIALLFS